MDLRGAQVDVGGDVRLLELATQVLDRLDDARVDERVGVLDRRLLRLVPLERPEVVEIDGAVVVDVYLLREARDREGQEQE